MKRTILLLIATFTVTFTLSCQMQSNDAQSELLKWEKEFAKAVVRNDVVGGDFLIDGGVTAISAVGA